MVRMVYRVRPYLDFTSNQCHNSPMIIKRLKSSVLNF